MKTFGQFNVGDTIYYYTKRDWNGPSDVKGYTLVQPVCNSEWSQTTEFEFYYEGDNYGSWYATIDCSSEDTNDTIILDRGYGDIIIKVFTSLEEAEQSRSDYITRLIKSHEESIVKLKEML